jgi:hypothetical protein
LQGRVGRSASSGTMEVEITRVQPQSWYYCL